LLKPSSFEKNADKLEEKLKIDQNHKDTAKIGMNLTAKFVNQSINRGIGRLID
jgi:hypothetical protein